MVLMNLFSTLTLCVLLRLPHHRPTSFASGGSGWIAHISRLYEKEMLAQKEKKYFNPMGALALELLVNPGMKYW